MNPQEFREFVLKSAQKFILESEDLEETKKILAQPKPPKLSKPTFTKRGVNEVPKEPKQPKAPDAPESASISAPKKTKTTTESCSPDKIKSLVEEMKKINKKIDLRNPLINPEFFDIISEETIVVKEDVSDRWKNLYNYEIPEDESR